MRKTIFILAFLFAILQQSQGQSIKQVLKLADSSYVQKDFFNAFLAYRDALKYDSSRTDILFKMAESARQFNTYLSAAEAYVKVIGSKDKAQYPDARLRLAEMLHKLGKYESALASYREYLTSTAQVPPNLAQIAQKGIDDCEFALKTQATEAQKGITDRVQKPESMGPQVNGPYTDYGASFFNDTLYHTAYEFAEAKDKYKLFNKVVRSFPGKNRALLPPSFNAPGKHTAYSTFTPDYKGVYFCLCDLINAFDLRCNIYYRELNKADALPLKLGINIDGVTSTSPAIGKNTLGEQVLYFASDRTGGKGKLDIWMGRIQADGNVLNAEAVAEINTSENDITPFYYEIPNKAQLLFFSTDGRPSFGGYDIYGTRLGNAKKWITPYNLGSNLNSSYDEIGYIRHPKGDSLIFSSNRPGSILLEKDQESCCYDLFKAEVVKLVDLEVNTFKRRDSLALNGTTVSIYEQNPDGTRKELVKKTDETGNQYKTLIERYKTYFIRAEKQGYITEDTLVIANLGEDQTTLVVNVYLPNLYLDVFTWIGPESAKNTVLNGCTVSIFEKTGTGQLNLINTSSKADSNGYSYNVLFEKVYYITATKAGYSPASAEVSMDRNTIDQFGYEVTIDLFLIPQGIDMVNGIDLFFDNAKPGPGDAETTTENYSKLYTDYLNKEKEFTGGKYGSLALESFFSNEVEAGYRKLQDLIPILKERLSSGMAVKIYADGYASPLGNIDYNRRLGARRMVSVINYLKIYGNGELKKFIDNQQLSFVLRAVGESPDGIDIPAALNNFKEEIFSTKASRARRVAITKISVTNVEQPK